MERARFSSKQIQDMKQRAFHYLTEKSKQPLDKLGTLSTAENYIQWTFHEKTPYLVYVILRLPEDMLRQGGVFHDDVMNQLLCAEDANRILGAEFYKPNLDAIAYRSGASESGKAKLKSVLASDLALSQDFLQVLNDLDLDWSDREGFAQSWLNKLKADDVLVSEDQYGQLANNLRTLPKFLAKNKDEESQIRSKVHEFQTHERLGYLEGHAQTSALKMGMSANDGQMFLSEQGAYREYLVNPLVGAYKMGHIVAPLLPFLKSENEGVYRLARAMLSCLQTTYVPIQGLPEGDKGKVHIMDRGGTFDTFSPKLLDALGVSKGYFAALMACSSDGNIFDKKLKQHFGEVYPHPIVRDGTLPFDASNALIDFLDGLAVKEYMASGSSFIEACGRALFREYQGQNRAHRDGVISHLRRYLLINPKRRFSEENPLVDDHLDVFKQRMQGLLKSPCFQEDWATSLPSSSMGGASKSEGHESVDQDHEGLNTETPHGPQGDSGCKNNTEKGAGNKPEKEPQSNSSKNSGDHKGANKTHPHDGSSLGWAGFAMGVGLALGVGLGAVAAFANIPGIDLTLGFDQWYSILLIYAAIGLGTGLLAGTITYVGIKSSQNLPEVPRDTQAKKNASGPGKKQLNQTKDDTHAPETGSSHGFTIK